MPEIETLREILSASRRAVFFDGAGMSTESGIPDFRSAGKKMRQDSCTEFISASFTSIGGTARTALIRPRTQQ